MRLYHNPISTCSQKVRMVLHEKGLAFEDTVLDLQQGEQFEPGYQALNPNAVVPTLEDQGSVMIESTLINEYLDDAYPTKPLKPVSTVERHQMRLFCKCIDDALHPACGVITYAIGVRPGLLQRSHADVDALLAKIPNAYRREVRRSVIDQGVEAGVFREAMLTHQMIFDQANALLSTQEWLAGSTFSLADCALMPYVIRIDHLSQGHEIDRRDHLKRWYAAIQQRPAFTQAVTNWAPPALVASFRQAGAAVAADIVRVLG